MKVDPQILLLFQTFAAKHRGIFTIHDLEGLFGTKQPVALQQKLRPFLQAKILSRFCRGFYVAKEFDLEWLSQRIAPDSAISLGTVLSREMVIGSIPQKTVYAVKVGKSRVYKSSLGQVVHLGFTGGDAKAMMAFGYKKMEKFIRYADKERAFLDALYFYQRGHKFSFNIYSDIQVKKLDQKIVNRYLVRYKNPKFVKFVEGVCHAKHTV
ncbi:MAG: hypothetical protein A3F82_01100 [Deltaproteobacteria bacterium RIFCSPLOWO2_12_FULL_44_12]|nr:MAG: hypothetical protein A2712_03855 [Deltaproteobacteria bacterium RIFCSPHIGHO2_01_FULL_43_49]OGQ16321.1 MAG: hypothetical protein A3D22_01825 [Deltaproteobacteria bacterium RIFCSPHIGHO2_02_FULL_44_53]OGQ29281.1 MAG: hypothetical protein A3D98_05610 [Deltaproteobacteria bacterium RIFCSPHIGHO2_12_FULL_44_21]OGQ32838.1 MAG: hypothetical protein A2979_09755 [Deltaproteobacteria bacterium RIFCSPLOWO2_01_FULL_45_74]OGQ41939.1 MAG: hypothetical protein A3I70_09540 [Deltaproteobacteria bacterium 